MPNTNALITLDHVVKSYLNELGSSSLADFNRYKQIVIEGFGDMNIHHTNQVDQFTSEVNGVNQLAAPADLIDWIGVYVVVSGLYWPLDFNEKLALPKESSCQVFYFEDHLLPPEKMGVGYTERRRNVVGTFAYDYKNRVFRFEGDLAGMEMYIVYVSSGIKTEGTTYVGRELLPLLKSYLNWIITERNPMMALAIKGRAEYLYGLELQRYDRLTSGFTAHDFLAAIRAGYTLGTKR